MPALLKILDDCAADLSKVWNVWSDDSPSPVLKEGPKADLSKIFDSEDYPAVALLKNQAGTVALVLLVDEQGSVADCTTVSTSGVAALDAQSCAIVMARGKFKPAIGLDGKPSKSAYSQRIRWTLQ